MPKVAKTDPNIRLTAEILESAKDLHSLGLLDDAGYQQIVLRHLDNAEVAQFVGSLSPNQSVPRSRT